MAEILDVAEFLCHDEQRRLVYEARQKGLHDYISGIEYAKKDKAVEIATKLLNQDLSITVIADATGLSES